MHVSINGLRFELKNYQFSNVCELSINNKRIRIEGKIIGIRFFSKLIKLKLFITENTMIKGKQSKGRHYKFPLWVS